MSNAGFQPLEDLMFQGAMDIVGDPVFLGILVMAFFFGFVMFQGLRFEAKAMFIIGGSLLAIAFIPVLAVIIGFGVGILVYLALNKVFNK